MKEVDLEKSTQFLDQVNLGCTQRECKPNDDLIDEYRQMVESRISAGATEKLPGSGNTSANVIVRSHDIGRHAQKCVRRYCELAIKYVEQV